MKVEEASVAATPAADKSEPAKPDAPTLSSLISDDVPLNVYGDEERTETPMSDFLTADDDIPEVEDIDADNYDDAHLFDDPAHDYSSDPYNFDDESDADGEGDANLPRDLTTAPEQDTEATVADGGSVEEADMSQTAILMPENSSDEAPVERYENKTLEGDAQGSVMPEDEAQALDASEPEEPTEPSARLAEPKPDSVKDRSGSIALTAKIAALETAIGQISETWEPDEAGEDEFAGTETEAMEWEDDMPDSAILARMNKPAAPDQTEPQAAPQESLETSAKLAPEQEEPRQTEAAAQPEAKKGDGFDYADEEQLIDEEALRDLVSDIVRAELQGALGERITRNVRKLVRREIHRALTAQEMD
ncbi:Glycerol-3-phosphate dehydrogenase [Sulfitobacter noctilucae]|nr:Glycerol-3-phosphate dehydrogenase [Sulfitobacter noctilucae]